MPHEFFEHASTSYLIDWIGSRNIDKHMPFRQYAASNAYSCCPPWPFWSRLSIWIYQPLTESCPETIMIWWNNEQILPFHQSNTAYWLRLSQMLVNSLFNLFLCMIVCASFIDFLSMHSKDMWFQVAELVRPVVTILTSIFLFAGMKPQMPIHVFPFDHFEADWTFGFTNF